MGEKERGEKIKGAWDSANPGKNITWIHESRQKKSEGGRAFLVGGKCSDRSLFPKWIIRAYKRGGGGPLKSQKIVKGGKT